MYFYIYYFWLFYQKLKEKMVRVVPYSIFVRRAIINLSSIPTRASDGTKSNINRVLKVAEVDMNMTNLHLLENPPTRPEPNVVTVLVASTPDSEGICLKSFPTIDLSDDPDVALRSVRYVSSS